MVGHRVLAFLVLLSVTGAGCLSTTNPAGTPTATETHSPTETAPTAVPTTATPSPTGTRTPVGTEGPCVLVVSEATEAEAMGVDESARRNFSDLPADQQAEFLGNTPSGAGDTQWNYSVEYVRHNGTWYATGVACP